MVKVEKLERKLQAHVSGEMTIYTATALKQELTPLLNDPRELEIKLGGVSEIDSAGVQLLMLVKKERARAKHPLNLSDHSSAVLDVFELMGLLPYFGDPVVLTGK